ncbi:hypothetical protein QA601_16505 [Chitinispirillales bacterium ANBcel5]|uniref:hypothetical protein n=1 Tax=Cellulosispirillum alkaliphilum TaxID=3039283 RepID=UPI002A5643F0|nr:hypothetical protein [Chitinispirillales bacterium ANBcel5]
MKKVLLSFALVLGVSLSAYAGNSGVHTTPLKIYSGGIGVGAMVPLEQDVDSPSQQLLRVSFINSWHFREHVSLFLDVNWFAPGLNVGADAGFDFLLSTSYFRPFFGFGIGAHHFESDEHDDFRSNFGPSATAHIGFELDITETVQVRARVPYYVVLNEERNHGAGLDIGVMFTSPLRRVRKLNY